MQETKRNMTQGEKIAYLRKRSGMTQAELGVRLNVTYQAVSKWERGDSYPDFDMISRIAKIFSVPIRFFENGVGNEALQEETATARVMRNPSMQGERLVGLCRKCGMAVYTGNEAYVNGELHCRSCANRVQAERETERQKQAATEEERLDRAHWRRTAGLITGGIVAIALFILCACGGEILSGAVLLLFGFTYVSQLFWNGAVVDCTLAGGHIIGTPGVIFSFDLDGFLFLIAIKLLFAVLRFIVWLATVMICALAAILISPFTFIPALKRANEGDIEFYD